MTCAWDAPDSPRSTGALFVLVVLADHASDHSGEDWAAYPSIARICARTQLHRDTVGRHLSALYDDGWISRRRRVRPDGKLGVYDFVIHRHADVRGELRAARRLERERSEAVECDGNHVGNYGMAEGSDHVGICGIAMSDFAAPPCRDLRPHEPLEEPSVEPSLGAREPGDEGFDEVLALWPERGRKRTKVAEARAAFALAAGEIGAGEMVSRVRRCVADGVIDDGHYGAPGLQRWLSEECWRLWAAADPERAVEHALTSPLWPSAAPDGLRAALLTAGIAAADADRCAWLAPNGLRPATGYAFDKLQREAGHVLRRFAIDLIRPVPRGIS